MELTEHSCKRCGGSLLSIGDGQWKCPYCGRIYDDESAARNTKTLKELFDQIEQENVNNLRRNLYDATSAEFVSNADVKKICFELKRHLPDDFAASFYEVACGSNLRAITQFIRKINVDENRDEIDGVINFLIRSLQVDYLLDLNNLVERAYKNTDLQLFEKYSTLISTEAEKVQNGIYETKLPREVFIAYSSKDMDKVSELCEVLESQGLKCFVAARNLRHGKGAVENYDKALKEAMDHCKSFVFVSSLNSRQFSCDALSIEIPYIEGIDKENAPAEYRNSYTAIPHQYKKPRVEYRIEESRGFNAADGITNEFFDGYERVYSPEEVARRILKQLVDVPVASAAKATETQKKICAACGAENENDAPRCKKCGGGQFVSDVSEYIKLKNAQELAKSRKREDERRAAAKSAPKTDPQKKNWGALIAIPVIAAVVIGTIVIISSIIGQSRTPERSEGDEKPETYPSAEYTDPESEYIEPESEDQDDPVYENGVNKYTGTYENITFTITLDGVLTISGSGDMPEFNNDWDVPWMDVRIYDTNYNGFDPNSIVETIVIEEGITSVGSYSFLNFGNVTEVRLASSVKRIGKQAFNGLTNLVSIDLSNVTDIGEQVFWNCPNLAEVELCDNIEHIGYEAFGTTEFYDTLYNENGYIAVKNCVIKVDPERVSGLIDGNLMPNITCIADHAFESLNNVTEIILPRGLKYIGDNAFADCDSITSITIPASVVSIGEGAFNACNNLSSVTLEDGSQLTSLGTGAFENCFSLSSLSFPSETLIEEIPDGLFKGCSALTKAIIPASVKRIGDEAFMSCGALVSVVIPEGSALESVGARAFKSCYDLSSVSFPKDISVSEIGEETFSECDSLLEIIIPDSVNKIGAGAFKYCDYLRNVVIPTSVTFIGEYAFGECTYLEAIIYLGSEFEWGLISKVALWDQGAGSSTASGSVTVVFMDNSYDTDNAEPYTAGLVFTLNSDGASYTVKSYAGTSVDVVIPSVYNGLPVVAIGNGSFSNNEGIKSVSIPASIEVIGESAFAYTTSLESVVIAEDSRLSEIGDIAFAYSEKLGAFTLPVGVKTLGDSIFKGCYALSQVHFADGIEIESIPQSMFQDCDSLKSVSVPQSVKRICTQAFTGSGLEAVELGENNQIILIESWAFSSCDSLKRVCLPASLESIGEAPFNYCGSIEYFSSTAEFIDEFPLDVIKTLVVIAIDDGEEAGQMIPSSAFDNLDTLETVILADDVVEIGYGAFAGCTNLKNVQLGSSLEVINQNAFNGCVKLETVSIPQSVSKIGSYAFARCSSLGSVTLPEGLSKIENGTFSECEALSEVVLCEGIISIGEQAFEKCYALKSIKLPDGLEEIGGYAFYGAGLEEIAIPESVQSMAYYAFGECSSLESISVTSEIPQIDPAAFSECPVKHATLHAGVILTLRSETFESVVITQGDIPASAFEGCARLREVTLPDTPDLIIGTSAFAGCNALMSITIPANIGGIGEDAFYECVRLVEVINHSSKNIVAGDAVNNGKVAAYALTVHKGESLIDVVDGYAFISVEGVNYLVAYVGEKTDIVLPDNYNGEEYTMLDGVFYNDDLITSATVNGVKRIPDKTFYGCDSLKTVEIGDGVEIIGKNAFAYCSHLESLTMSDSVTEIQYYAFSYCLRMDNPKLSQNLEHIGEGAFANCSELTKVALPGSVLRIGKDAFANCVEMIGVSFADTSYTWNWYLETDNQLMQEDVSVDDSSVNVLNFRGYHYYIWLREDVSPETLG